MLTSLQILYHLFFEALTYIEKVFSEPKRKPIKNVTYWKNRESGYISDDDFEENISETRNYNGTADNDAFSTDYGSLMEETNVLTSLIDYLQSMKSEPKSCTNIKVRNITQKKDKKKRDRIVSKKVKCNLKNKERCYDGCFMTRKSDEMIFNNCQKYKDFNAQEEVVEELQI